MAPITMNTKTWNDLGFWEWKCGCVQFQDGYELCPKHRSLGYQSLKKESNGTN